MDKRGDYKWSIILSLILGLLVLGLSLFFIFNEYFTGEDTDLQICRQSIQVRALLPEVKKFDVNFNSFKDDFPLKCKTTVKTIDKEDVEQDQARAASIIIADAMAECWALYDKGDSNAFPSKPLGISSTCVPCARIHLTEEAKKYMLQNGVEINIRDSLDLQMNQGYTYYNFLMNSGDKFSAFDFATSNLFNLSADGFLVDNTNQISGNFINRMGGSEEGFSIFGFDEIGVSEISLPGVFDLKAGDLLINYGIITTPREGGVGGYIPYLFYFQANEKPSPFDSVKEQFVDSFYNANFCDQWDGIPA